MITLTPTERRALRARAHPLHPVVSISAKGLSAAVLGEIDRALEAHELIKLRVYGQDRAAREKVLAEACQGLGCAAVQHIGHILVLFRPRKPETPSTPAMPRHSARMPSPSATKPRRPRSA